MIMKEISFCFFLTALGDIVLTTVVVHITDTMISITAVGTLTNHFNKFQQTQNVITTKYFIIIKSKCTITLAIMIIFKYHISMNQQNTLFISKYNFSCFKINHVSL
jgi:hypothetical protein